MILELGLLALALNFSGYGFYRSWLLLKYRRKMAVGEFEAALNILFKFQRMPWPKGAISSKLVDVAILKVATIVRDYQAADIAWERLTHSLDGIKQYVGVVYATRADSLAFRGRYRQALDCLNEAPHSPHFPSVKVELCFSYAAVYIQLGEFERALDYLSQVEETFLRDPSNSLMKNLLSAQAEFGLGQIEAARQSLSRVPERLPGGPATWAHVNHGLALWYARCGMVDQAELRLEQADLSHLSKILSEVRVAAKAEIAAAKGQIDEALSYFRDLRALEVKSALSYLRAARLAESNAEVGLAQSFLQFAVEIDPESHWAKVAQKRLDR